MDRPRSPVKDAGLWVRSIQPLRCPPVAKHEERGRLPRRWERRPRSLMPIRLSGAALRSCPDCRRSVLRATGRGCPPVPRLLQPGRDDRERLMIVIAVNHLLDVVVVVVVAFVSDVLPVADLVADGATASVIGATAHRFLEIPATRCVALRTPPVSTRSVNGGEIMTHLGTYLQRHLTTDVCRNV